jgi:Na+/melibiose symporter-like transporter
MTKIVAHQQSVKSWGTCFKYFAYFMLVGSWMTLIGNVISFFFADKFLPPIEWYDSVNDKHHRIKLDSYGLGVMCLLKAASSFFSFKQARWTLNVFKPILKEYADAEAGRTQGIQMTERKTKKMKTLQKQIRKLTCGMFAFCLVCTIYGGSWLGDQSDRFIQVYYHTQNFPNASISDEYFKVENEDGEWTPYNIWGDDEG